MDTQKAFVAIVGRPNVGKSSLFNQFIKRKVAIIEDRPGVTRDRLESDVLIGDEHIVCLMDTGGIGQIPDADSRMDLKAPIDGAFQKADVFLFVVDSRSGLTPEDQDVAKRLRASNKPVILIVNKSETKDLVNSASEFWSLGLGEPLSYSVHDGFGFNELKSRLISETPQFFEEANKDLPRVALLGRRNVGKSTLLNFLSQDKRVIVSDVEGTTRDFVEVVIDRFPRDFIVVDTAGLKRPNWENTVDFFSLKRTERVIRECDACLLLIDGADKISGVDKKLASILRDLAKPTIVVVNKWDLAVKNVKTGEFMDYFDSQLKGLLFAPVAFASALKGDQVKRTIKTLFEVIDQGRKRVSTGQLNRLVETATAQKSLSSYRGHQAKIFFASQVDVSPPTFVFKVNDPRLVSKEYRRYLENFLREHLDVPEIPLKLVFRRRDPK